MILRTLFFALFVRPIVLVIVGINLRHRERLPIQGPAILVANHNSHLDTMVLMCIFPLRMLRLLRPAAAADYFLKGRLMTWFSTQVIGIIPVARRREGVESDPLQGVSEALGRGEIVIFFPEGTRGEPEKLVQFKSGIAHLASRFPKIPVYPFFMHGLGKALPKGEAILIPFFCDVFAGDPIFWTGEKASYLEVLQSQMKALADEGHFPAWD